VFGCVSVVVELVVCRITTVLYILYVEIFGFCEICWRIKVLRFIVSRFAAAFMEGP